MSTRVGDAETPIIASRDELVAELEAGVKPENAWRIGTEHEKFCFYKKDYSPVPYEGARGISALLTGLQQRCGEPVLEAGQHYRVAETGLFERRRHHSGARRSARTVWRAAGDCASDLPRDQPAPR